MFSTTYLIDYEISENGEMIRWGNCCFGVSIFTNKKKVQDMIRVFIAEHEECEPNMVRMLGVFKL